jgi:RNA polymerase sigma factor (sigma-70 family)
MTAVVSPELVRRAQSRDEDAVNEVLTQVDRVVCRLARKGGAQHADAEDRAQEIRIALFQKAIPRWTEDGGASFPTYAWWWANSKVRVLRTSAARRPKEYSLGRPERAVSGASDNARRAAPRSGTGTTSIASLLRNQVSVVEKLGVEELADLLRKSFNFLKPDERTLLTLRFWEDKTLREISRGTKSGEIDLGRPLSHQGCLSLERRALKHLEKVIRFLTSHRAERARTKTS